MRILAFLGALVATVAMAASPNIVQIDTGQISGTTGNDPSVRVYKGIPYASPPVGSLRWRPAEPPARWEGVRKADEFSHACMQEAPDASLSTGSKLLHDAQVENVSEDCLYLNVWTATKSASEKRPVMVFMHGGALVTGSGDVGLYDGEALAKKGVVYVDLNYRLGALGFLALPELTKESEHHSSGNYGFLDQVAALRWVQRNIAAFGGDPKRVTIFGQSAGSGSVNALMASPLAKGLFSRVIAESHLYLSGVPTQAEAEEQGLKFAKAAGASSLAQLRALSATEILKVQLQSRFASRPNVDGWYIPSDIYTIYKTGKQNDVPLIAGSNSDESLAYAEPITTAAYTAQVHQRYGDQADEFLRFYPGGTSEQVSASRTLSETDTSSSYPARTLAQLQSHTGKSKAYLYRFSHVPPLAGPDAAVYNNVFHGAELYYVFQQWGFKTEWAWTDMDRKLGEIMSSYWVHFAASGNPNGEGLPKWPAYEEKSDELMNFGEQIGVAPVPRKDALTFLDAHFHSSSWPLHPQGQ